MNHVDLIFNLLGIAGSILLLFGFYRVSVGRWNNKSFWYEFDNVLGALLIITYQIRYHAFVSVVVNLIWGAVALWGVVTFARRVHHHRRRKQAQAKPARRRKA